MIVEPDAAAAHALVELARKAAPGAQVYFAKDGYEALFRLKNVDPTVIITGLELNKYFSGYKLIDSILAERRISGTSIVVVAEAPAEEFCVNQVVSGQIQFVGRHPLSEVFELAVQRAIQRSRGDHEVEFRLISLAQGEKLFAEGENAENAYLLKKGKLRAFRERNGKVEVFGEILPGEFVGEMAYIDGEPRSASVDALEAADLIEVPLRCLDSIVFSKPAWSKALLKTLSKRLKGANNKRAA